MGSSLVMSPLASVCACTPIVQTASDASSQSCWAYWKSHAHCLPIAVMQASGSSYWVSSVVWSRAVKAKKPSTRMSGTIV